MATFVEILSSDSEDDEIQIIPFVKPPPPVIELDIDSDEDKHKSKSKAQSKPLLCQAENSKGTEDKETDDNSTLTSGTGNVNSESEPCLSVPAGGGYTPGISNDNDNDNDTPLAPSIGRIDGEPNKIGLNIGGQDNDKEQKQGDESCPTIRVASSIYEFNDDVPELPNPSGLRRKSNKPKPSQKDGDGGSVCNPTPTNDKGESDNQISSSTNDTVPVPVPDKSKVTKGKRKRSTEGDSSGAGPSPKRITKQQRAKQRTNEEINNFLTALGIYVNPEVLSLTSTPDEPLKKKRRKRVQVPVTRGNVGLLIPPPPSDDVVTIPDVPATTVSMGLGLGSHIHVLPVIQTPPAQPLAFQKELEARQKEKEMNEASVSKIISPVAGPSRLMENKTASIQIRTPTIKETEKIDKVRKVVSPVASDKPQESVPQQAQTQIGNVKKSQNIDASNQPSVTPESNKRISVSRMAFSQLQFEEEGGNVPSETKEKRPSSPQNKVKDSAQKTDQNKELTPTYSVIQQPASTATSTSSKGSETSSLKMVIKRKVPVVRPLTPPPMFDEDDDDENLPEDFGCYDSGTAKPKDYLPLHWSKEMMEFYDSKDPEKSRMTLRKVLAGMSDDPSLWETKEHLFPRTLKKKGPRCVNCCQIGHLARDCREKRKKIVCHICGEEGHRAERKDKRTGRTFCSCPHALCLNCGRKHGRFEGFTKGCPKCIFTRNKVTCSTCGVEGHGEAHCPDNWRRYFATTSATETDDGLVLLGQEAEYKLHKDSYCCICAQKGHNYFNCRNTRQIQRMQYARQNPRTIDSLPREPFSKPKVTTQRSETVSSATDNNQIAKNLSVAPMSGVQTNAGQRQERKSPEIPSGPSKNLNQAQNMKIQGQQKSKERLPEPEVIILDDEDNDQDKLTVGLLASELDLIFTESIKNDGLIRRIKNTFKVGIFVSKEDLNVVIQDGSEFQRKIAQKNIVFWLECQAAGVPYAMQYHLDNQSSGGQSHSWKGSKRPKRLRSRTLQDKKPRIDYNSLPPKNVRNTKTAPSPRGSPKDQNNLGPGPSTFRRNENNRGSWENKGKRKRHSRWDQPSQNANFQPLGVGVGVGLGPPNPIPQYFATPQIPPPSQNRFFNSFGPSYFPGQHQQSMHMNPFAFPQAQFNPFQNIGSRPNPNVPNDERRPGGGGGKKLLRYYNATDPRNQGQGQP